MDKDELEQAMVSFEHNIEALATAIIYAGLCGGGVPSVDNAHKVWEEIVDKVWS